MRIPVVMMALALTACGTDKPAATPIDEAPAPIAKCAAPVSGVYGAYPLKNKTKADVELAGTADQLISVMSETGCFTIAERDKIDILIEEISRCDPASKDAGFWKCESFAKKGQLLGLTDMVVGDLILFDPKVSGSELHAKLPWIGGITMDQTYTAVALSLRIVHFENGVVRASTDVSATVPARDAGIDLSAKGFDLGATLHSRTPLGRALGDMLRDGMRKLNAQLGS